jgi:hypothetical protein
MSVLHDDDLPGYLYKRAGSRFWWMYFSMNGQTVRLSTKKRHEDAAKAVWRNAVNAARAKADSAVAARAAIQANGFWDKTWRETIAQGMRSGGWAMRAYRQSTDSAKARGMAHDLTPGQFTDALMRSAGYCELTGIKFDFVTRHRLFHPWKPSIDRIDSGIGYTADNVRIVCIVVNLALSHWGEEVLERIAIALLVRKHLQRDPSPFITTPPLKDIEKDLSNSTLQ